jgi:hypothetical protein
MKMMKKVILQAAAIFLVFGSVVTVSAQPPGPIAFPPPVDPQEKTVSSIEKISAGKFRIGDLQINKKNKSVSFPASVNMDKGLLEYLIVQASGKTHESLFRTKVAPYDLQIAFLLLGFEGTDQPLSSQGAPERPKGEPIDISVDYSKADGKPLTIHPEEWIVTKTQDGKEHKVDALDWVFTGSMVAGGRFIAQESGSIAAIYHDPSALIDNASPGGESDEVWFVKEGTVPPVGTPVTITIKAKK